MSKHIPIVDMHCHPAMKAFGQTFPGGKKNRGSLWFRDKPDIFEKLANFGLGLTKFTQADMTSLASGNVTVVCASMYALEKKFVRSKLGTGALGDAGVQLLTSMNKGRIDHLQNMPDYFTDLLAELQFWKDGQQETHSVNGNKWNYRLVKNMAEVDATEASGANTICVVPTIEGAHVFNSGLQTMGRPAADEQEMLANVRAVKKWEQPPFFMTFAHHFDNEHCGHARSFADGIQSLALEQRDRLGEGFTELGWKVLKEMLSTTNGRRIIIDIKHMSPLSRRQYIDHVQALRNDPIPLIVSHGAVNGVASKDDPIHRNPSTRGLFNNSGLLPEEGSRFPVSINFYDDEILAIGKSQGIFGLQLDERRIASKEVLKDASGKLTRRKILFYRSRMVWNQVQHIAEVLDAQGQNAWDITAIGTDFDGIIDTLNGFWSSEDLNDLDEYLLMHAHNYLASDQNTLKQPFNRNIDPETLVDKVMFGNAMGFLRRWFV